MVDESVTDSPTPNAPEDPPPSPAAADPLDALRQERDSLQDRLLRTAAEFDNYRKRIERERREQADHAMFDLLSDVLPVVDDLERALQVPAGPEADA